MVLGSFFLYSFPICPRPILVVCCLLHGLKNLTNCCHGDSHPAYFSSPVCSSREEAGKNAEAGFIRWSPDCHNRKQWMAESKSSIYIVNGTFVKGIAFKGTIRKFLNKLAVHIEGIRHSPKCLFDTLFSCQCHFKEIHNAVGNTTYQKSRHRGKCTA
jgi:hypothetical protein